MALKHTPGPWQLEIEPSKLKFDSNTGEMLPLQSPKCWIKPQGEALIIAHVPYNGFGPDITEANARLIVAAPKMFELLQDLRDSLEGFLPDRCGKEYTDICNLISKIEVNAL